MNHKISSLITSSALLAMVACAAPEASVSRAEAASEADKVAVDYRSPGKPSASLSLSHALRDTVLPGGSGVLTVMIDDGYDTGTMVLTASASGDMVLANNSSQASFSMEGKERHVWDIYFNAGAAGVHYIDINAVVSGVDGASTLSYSAPVKVGTGAPASKLTDPTMVTTPDGENIIMMEAEETIED